MKISLTKTNETIAFSFHPDLGKLWVLAMSPDDGETDVTERTGVVLELEVAYDSCEELTARPTWTGKLVNVYQSNLVLHAEAIVSIPFEETEDGRCALSPEEIPYTCYGTYTPDPQNPAQYTKEGTTDKDGQHLGLWVAKSPGKVPWGFQNLYNHLKIDGLQTTE